MPSEAGMPFLGAEYEPLVKQTGGATVAADLRKVRTG